MSGGPFAGRTFRVARPKRTLQRGDTIQCERVGCTNRVPFLGGIARFCSKACRRARHNGRTA